MDEPRDTGEQGTEVFERIPWDSLDPPPDRRWMAYLVAGAVLLAAVGISVGRQMASAPTIPSVLTPTNVPVATAPTIPPVPSSTVPPSTTTPLWSEADLMALPAESVEAGAAVTAEWFLVDHFTLDEPDSDRSFVEWVGTKQVHWISPALARATVMMRRLAAPSGEPYQRLATEAWDVVVRLDDDGWTVVGGPFRVEEADIAVEIEPHSITDPAGQALAVESSDWTGPVGIEWAIQEWE